MEKSLGLVEVAGLSSAVETADVMVKAANVTLAELEAARGSGMMPVKVTGDVGAVKAAVEAGRAAAAAMGALVSADVIARPAGGTGDLFVRYTGEKKRPNFYGVSEPAAEPVLAESPAVTASVSEEPADSGVSSNEPPADKPEQIIAPAAKEPEIQPAAAENVTEGQSAPLQAPETQPAKKTVRPRRTRRSSKAKKTTQEEHTTPES